MMHETETIDDVAPEPTKALGDWSPMRTGSPRKQSRSWLSLRPHSGVLSMRTVKLFRGLLAAIALFCGLETCPARGGSPELSRAIESQKDLVYCQVDQQRLLADVYRPADEQLHPGVLVIHGGAWSSGDKWNVSDHARELAQAGYVAVAINYRLAPASKYPAQIEDCREALRWMVREAGRFKIDMQRLGVYGYSAGGHLAAMLATDPVADQPKVKVAVAGGAPCDFDFIPEDSRAIAHVLGGTRGQFPLLYREASPLTYASSDDCPMFFFHGASDLIVPPEASRVLCDRLAALGVETCYYSVDKQGHLVTFIHPEARRAAIEFLNKHLQQDH